MTRYYNERNKFNKTDDDVISVQNYHEDYTHREFFCNYCQRTMSKLTDRSGLSPSWYCTNCSIEVDPSITEVRSKSPLTTRDEPPDNPAVAYPPEPELKRKKTELPGAFDVLRKRGMRFTSYTENKG